MLNLELHTDISSHNNAKDTSGKPLPINFVKMREAGAKLVAIRHTIGNRFDDAFEMNYRGARDAGLRTTVYCVPFVGLRNFDKQMTVLGQWPSGGTFDGELDDAAWEDVEWRHKTTQRRALRDMLDYLYRMAAVYGAADIYTAKSIFNNYYSRKSGWAQDWPLIVANYRPDLYHLSVQEVMEKVARQEIHPAVPRGWLYDKAGNQIPSALRWKTWQIMADSNNLGPEFGVGSDSIDIDFHQAKLEPPPPPGSDLREKVLRLRQAFGETEDALTEVEELVGA